MAPSRTLNSAFGTTKSGSTSRRVPKPVHSGHAPNGELKEKDRGSSSSNETPHFMQARCSLNIRSRLGSFSDRSMKSRTTTPLDRRSAVSTESVKRRRDSALTARRSTTTSILCFSCFLSIGTSSRPTTTPSTRTREYPCDCSCLNISLYSPLRSRTTGAST